MTLHKDEIDKKLSNTKDELERIDLMNDYSYRMYSLDNEYARKLASKALEAARVKEYKRGVAQAILNKGIGKYVASEYDEALTYLEEGETILKSIPGGREAGLNRIFRMMGIVYLEVGQQAKAADYYREALNLSEEIGDLGETGSVYSNLAVLYDRLNKLEEALAYSLKAVEILKKTDNYRVYTTALNNTGHYYNQLGNYSKALEFLQKAYEIALTHNTTSLHAVILTTMGEVYQNIKKYDIAMERYLEGLRAARKAKNYWSTASLLRHLGILSFETEDYQEAERYLKKSLELSQERQIHEFVKQTHKLLWELYDKQDNIELAYDHLMQFHELEKRTFDLEMNRTIRNIEADSLRRTNERIKAISRIGREITATLELKGVLEKVYQSVNSLMDAAVFGVAHYDNKSGHITYDMFIEDGVLLDANIRSVDDANSLAALVIREDRDIIINDYEKEYKYFLPGLDDIRSNLFGLVNEKSPSSILYIPIHQSDHVTGVITAQSFSKNAYSLADLETLKALGGYAAVALKNARQTKLIQKRTEELQQAINELRQTQEQLIQSEKLAALGQLTSNVSHEINTPLGAIKSAIGHINSEIKTLIPSLPDVVKNLPDDLYELFLKLLHRGARKKRLSAREERRMKKNIKASLAKQGIELDGMVIMNLLIIGVDNLEEFFPLLQSPLGNTLLNTAYKMSTIIQNADIIQSASQKASKISFALKSYAHFDNTGQQSIAHIQKTIETVLTLYTNQIKQGVKVVKKYQDIPPVQCYPDELNQVWINLIYNALQAMNNQGTLTITISGEGDFVSVSFADTGKGITEDVKDKIFDPFFTTKSAGEGSGLGLYIAKIIVDKHNGHIEVAGEPGQGAVVTVILPAEE